MKPRNQRRSVRRAASVWINKQTRNRLAHYAQKRGFKLGFLADLAVNFFLEVKEKEGCADHADPAVLADQNVTQ